MSQVARHDPLTHSRTSRSFPSVRVSWLAAKVEQGGALPTRGVQSYQLEA